MHFSKRRGMSNTEAIIVIIVVASVVGGVTFYVLASIQNGLETGTTQAAGKIIYYSISDGGGFFAEGQQVTMVIQNNLGASQTLACPLAIYHQQNSGGPFNTPLVQASDPSILLGLKVGDDVSVISGINGCNITVFN